MELSDVLRKPFSDFKNLVLGSIIGLIPILNFALVGYGFDNYARPKKLPAWDVKRQLLLGFKMSFVGLVFLIVPAGITYFGMRYQTGTLTFLGVLSFVGMLIPSTRAMIEVGTSDSISAGFEISKVLEKAYSKKFVTSWIVATLLSVAVSFIMSFIPIIGWFFENFVATVIFWTYLGSNA